MNGGGNFLQAAAAAPRTSGVYFLMSRERELLYIGRARDLRARLMQHAAAKPGRGQMRLTALYENVQTAVWQQLPDEMAACAREADLIVALRPRFNASQVGEGRWNFVTVSTHPSRPGIRRFRLTPAADWEGRRGYGCFPHLGRGVSSPPAVMCSDGYTALLRLIWAASSDPGGSFPGRLTRAAPDDFQASLAPRLDAPLHEFLSGTSDRLLIQLVTAAAKRGPVIAAACERDEVIARGFLEHGPRSIRRLRLRHGRRAGPMPRPMIEELLRGEVRQIIGEFSLADLPDPNRDPLGRRARRWSRAEQA